MELARQVHRPLTAMVQAKQVRQPVGNLGHQPVGKLGHQPVGKVEQHLRAKPLVLRKGGKHSDRRRLGHPGLHLLIKQLARLPRRVQQRHSRRSSLCQFEELKLAF